MKDKPFSWYLQEALKELEKEDWDSERCEKLLTEYCNSVPAEVVIDNKTGETIQIKAESPEKALAEALKKLSPGVRTIVEE